MGRSRTRPGNRQALLSPESVCFKTGLSEVASFSEDGNVNYPPILITCNEMECSEGFVCVDGRVSGPDEPIQPVEVFCRPAGASKELKAVATDTF